MNPKILALLPNKRNTHNYNCSQTASLNREKDKEYNISIDDVITALSKVDLAIVPSEIILSKKIEEVLKSSCSCNDGSGIVCVGCFYSGDLAKAIRSLMLSKGG